MKKLVIIILIINHSISYSDQSKQSGLYQLDAVFSAAIKTNDTDPLQALSEVQGITPKTDNQQAQLQLVLSQIYSNLDYPDKMLHHTELGLKKIDVQSEPWLFNFLTVTRIEALDRLDKGGSEIETLQSIIDWSTVNQQPELTALALIQISYLYIKIEDYKKALDAIQSAAKFAPDSGLFVKKSDVAYHMAAIYVHRNEFELALPYFEASYAEHKANQNFIGMSVDLFEMGRANLELMNNELGVLQLLQSIEVSTSIGDDQGIAYANAELAYHYINQQEYALAEKALSQAGQLFKQASNANRLFDIIIQSVRLNTELGDFQTAQSYLDEATALNQLHQIRYGQITIDKNKSSLLAAQGDYQGAYETYLQARQSEDTLESQLSAEKLHEVRARYEVESNALKNQLLAEQNQEQVTTIKFQTKLNTIMLISIGLLGLLLFLSLWLNQKLKKQGLKLHELANFDELSGLKNRSNIVSSIRSELEKLNQDDQFSLVMIDLDHFKTINDTYGHALGDKVLQTFGSYCLTLNQHTNLIGRLGGEEFLIGFNGNEPGSVYQLIDELRIKTEKMPSVISAPGLKVSLSAGICYSHGSHRFRDILKVADDVMYEAKRKGRNQIVTAELD